MLLPSAIFFFNDTATTEIYTLSLHDALPISALIGDPRNDENTIIAQLHVAFLHAHNKLVDEEGHNLEQAKTIRSEEHTSELQSRQYLVCRLLLEKKNEGEINVATDDMPIECM